MSSSYDERENGNRRLLVRSHSQRIRRLPSLDYTPPYDSSQLPLRRSYSGSDQSIVYVHEPHEPSPLLEHSTSAPESAFRKYLRKLGRKKSRKRRTERMASVAENERHEWNHGNERQPLLKEDSIGSMERIESPQDSRATVGGKESTHEESLPFSFGLSRVMDCLRHEKQLRLFQIAVSYLMDHLASRPPTLPPDSDLVSDRHLFLHWLRFSRLWKTVIASATISLFFASVYEKQGPQHGSLLLTLTYFAVLVFLLDMAMTKLLFGQHCSVSSVSSTTLQFRGSPEYGGTVQAFASEQTTKGPGSIRKSRSRWWAFPLVAFLVALSVETAVVVFLQDNTKVIWTSAWKPVVLFYASPKARNALDAMNRVSRIVFKVLFMELFLIFTFGAVACQLYGLEFESFGGLASSFLSMYEISTLVATPGLWMPIANKHPTCAIFFVLFLVTCVFYLHSLVLSVVFQSYMEGLMIIRDHAASDKEETLRLAFQTLYRATLPFDRTVNADAPITIRTKGIRKLFMLMRPNYGREKINALVKIVDPYQSGHVDYNSFRQTMLKAMITSVKTARPHNKYYVMLEISEAILAIGNLVYVILASSNYESPWWMHVVVPVGGIITMLCIVDLLFRFGYSQKHYTPPAWELDATFDLLAYLAVVVSVVGLVLNRFELERSLDWLITGRAIDQMRILRLATEARGIVRRSGELLPYVVGPVVLVVTALHMITYLCMAIWGGAVVVGNNTNIPPYYDLNNFNSYPSGLMTIFNMLVANDWHLLAQVFVLPSHPKTSKLVYPFFIGVNLIIVSILLNVLTAFFVGAFVTRTSWRRTRESLHATKRTSTHTANSSLIPLRPVLGRTVSIISSDELDDESSEDITMSERQDFDDVLNATMGKGDHKDDDAANYCCHLLDLYETLSGQDRQVGYLVSCQQSMSRYGNHCFEQMVHRFMGDDMLHTVIEEMHSELTALPRAHETSVHRSFQLSDEEQSSNQSLELAASVLKEGSSVALFLAKIA